MSALDHLITSQVDTADLVGDDPTGTLLTFAHETSGHVFVACRDYRQALRALAHPRRPQSTIAGIDAPFEDVIQAATGPMISRLPGSLSSLDLLARTCARAGHPIITGANTKHMTRTQNGVLASSYGDVHASLGRGKFRCLIGENPAMPAPHEPWSEATDYGTLWGYGGVFGGSKVDRGGEFLARTALAYVRPTDDVIDLGCGNGLVSLMLSGRVGSIRATDVDLDAVAAARLTLGEKARVSWDDAGAGLEPSSADVVLLNPPFHAGTTVDTRLVDHLLQASMRLLRPGGHLFLVHNSHVRYRGRMGAWRVRQLARNPKFTVLGAQPRSASS